MQVVNNWFDYHRLKDAGIPVKYVKGSKTKAVHNVAVPSNPPPITTSPNQGSGPMDLGALVADLGTAYINAKYSQAAPVVPTVQPVNSLTDSLGIPFVDVIPEPPQTECGGSMVYKKVCGQYKWVKQKRRRKQRLATRSDLKDLAALKGVLGQGKLLETWIATHS